jgi:hypothetical protein
MPSSTDGSRVSPHLSDRLNVISGDRVAVLALNTTEILAI